MKGKYDLWLVFGLGRGIMNSNVTPSQLRDIYHSVQHHQAFLSSFSSYAKMELKFLSQTNCYEDYDLEYRSVLKTLGLGALNCYMSQQSIFKLFIMMIIIIVLDS